MSDDTVRYTLDGPIARIELDDGKVNALSHPLMQACLDALDRAEAEARAVLLIGRPGRFSAGFDLRGMMAGRDAAVALVRQGAQLFTRLFAFPRPVVIACTGHAIAGGALILLTADRRIGARGDSKIGLNEVAIQMTLPRLGVELASARLDRRHLTEATLCARLYTPDEAAAIGFLDRVVEPDALIDAALAEATALARYSRDAFAGTKQRLREHTLARIERDFERDLAELVTPAGRG